ncbi:UDP-N-acetylmuramoyl-tripeptide--D-alanyl-D-alanine ligase [Syntrophomonas erecta]
MSWNLDFISCSVKAISINANLVNTVNGITTDSRRVVPGQLFIALKGENFDGHDFIDQAFQAGAAAAIISVGASRLRKKWPQKAIIEVRDTLQALQDLAAANRQRFSLPVIAVTGSVGKTTTKEIIAACLRVRYHTLKTQGNFNNDIGMPLTILRLDQDYQAVVVEMGMRAPEEIRRLARIANPTSAVITNVEPVHLETLGTLDNIAKAKCEVLEQVKDFAVLNGDNPYLMKAAGPYTCRKYTFGYNRACDFQIRDPRVNRQGIQFQLCMSGHKETLSFPVPSLKLAENAAAASAAAYLTGLSWDEIKQGLLSYQPSGNRLHVINLKEGGIIINDTYNANPVSMGAALEMLYELRGTGRLVAVLGDMYELGSYEERGHREVGEKAAQCKVDLLITVGVRAGLIAEAALEAGLDAGQVRHFTCKLECLAFLKKNLIRSDAILFKASRGMQLETLIDEWLG